MSKRVRPQVVVFDVVETLASLDPVADRFAEHGVDRSVLAAWFTRLLRDAMALTAAGGYAGFAEVATSALHAETRGELTAAQVAPIVQRSPRFAVVVDDPVPQQQLRQPMPGPHQILP